MFLIVLAVIAACVCVLVYGYRHPTSKIGLFMIEVCLYDVCVCTEQYVNHATRTRSFYTLDIRLHVAWVMYHTARTSARVTLVL